MTTTPEVSPTRVAAVAEDLYALLPAHIRQVDLAAGGSMRALFGVLAGASAEPRRRARPYYDALFVETADHAALPQLAALVGAIPLQPLPPGAAFDERAYVANTIRYRRGKGTAPVLESLAADVTGSPAVAVEYLLRIARLQHLLDVRPERPATGLVVDGETEARAGSGFDRLPRLLDVRAVAPGRGRPTGRHGIPSVGVHMLRPVVPVFPSPRHRHPGAGDARRRPPGAGMDGRRSHPDRLLPAGGPARARATALFGRPGGRRRRWTSAGARPARPAAPTAAAPGDRRAARGNGGGPAAAADRPAVVRRAGAAVPRLRPPIGSDRLRRRATREAAHRQPGRRPAGPPAGDVDARLVLGQCRGRHPAHRPRRHHLRDRPGDRAHRRRPPPSGTPDIVEVRVAYATGRGRPIGAGAQERGSAEQPFEIRDDGPVHDLVWVVDPAAPTGGSAETSSRTVGTLAQALTEVDTLGTGRRSFVVLARCDLEGVPSGSTSLDVTVPSRGEVHLVAAEWRTPLVTAGTPGDPALRGFVVRRERRFTVDAPVRVQAPSGAAMRDAGRLVVDGLELTQGLVLATRLGAQHGAAALDDPLARCGGRVLHHQWHPHRPRRPGDRRDLRTHPAGWAGRRRHRRPHHLRQRRRGRRGGHRRDPGAGSRLLLANVTVLGTSAVRALEATNVLFDEPVTVTRRQSGCVRHSWVPEGSATPRGFRCQPQLALAAAREAKGAPLGVSEAAQVRLSVRPVLMDRSLDEPTVAMLHAMCPDAIVRGGEDEAEMGAFSATGWGIARANLVSLFDDFVPSALRAGVIDDTRSAAVAQRRNRP